MSTILVVIGREEYEGKIATTLTRYEGLTPTHECGVLPGYLGGLPELVEDMRARPPHQFAIDAPLLLA